MQRHRPRRHELGLYLGLASLTSWAAWPLVVLNPFANGFHGSVRPSKKQISTMV
jgi:hypothetical protein